MKNVLSKYPDLKSFSIERNDLIESMRSIFYSSQVLVLYSDDDESNGKNSLANLYTKKSLKEFGLIWWFNGKSIDFQFRSFANVCLRLKTWSLDKMSLIQKVKSVLTKFSSKVLFVFYNVESFQVLEDYVQDLPFNVKILITTKDQNLPRVFHQRSSLLVDGFSRKEAEQFFKKNLPDKEILGQLFFNYFITFN